MQDAYLRLEHMQLVVAHAQDENSELSKRYAKTDIRNVMQKYKWELDYMQANVDHLHPKSMDIQREINKVRRCTGSRYVTIRH